MLCAQYLYARAGGQRLGHHTGGHHRRGDDLPRLHVQAEALELVGHHVLEARGVVRGVFDGHAGGFGRTNGIGCVFDRILAAIHHAVEVQQRKLIGLGERAIGAFEETGHYAVHSSVSVSGSVESESADSAESSASASLAESVSVSSASSD